jgi:hypothetical protein
MQKKVKSDKAESLPKVSQQNVSKKIVSTKFLTMMSLVSLIGFFGIAMKTLFEQDVDAYVEISWLLLLGLELVLESDLKSMLRIKKTGLTSEKFTKLVTAVIGFIAILTGILLLPQIGLRTPALLAIQGVISVVAIIFIILQTWVLKQ